jgi:hypothetical protein
METIKTWQERQREHFATGTKAKREDQFKDDEIADLRAALASQVQAAPVGAVDDLETLLTTFDMGLGFALCHRDFADTRNAVKQLQEDFSAIRAAIAQRASVKAISFEEWWPTMGQTIGEVVARQAFAAGRASVEAVPVPEHPSMAVCAVWLDSAGSDILVRLHDGNAWHEVLRQTGPTVNASVYGDKLLSRVTPYTAPPAAAKVAQDSGRDAALKHAIEQQIYHCEMNDVRLPPELGDAEGQLAVPVAYLKAALSGMDHAQQVEKQ